MVMARMTQLIEVREEGQYDLLEENEGGLAHGHGRIVHWNQHPRPAFHSA